MQSIPFQLEVTKGDDTPCTGLNFSSSLTMPAMPMPPNNPKVAARGDLYSGSLVFTMAGAWQATFTAETGNGQNIVLVFDIPRVLMK